MQTSDVLSGNIGMLVVINFIGGKESPLGGGNLGSMH